MTFSIPNPPADRVALLNALKKFAKSNKKANPGKLAQFQDQIAIAFGYLNWSLLQKDVLGMSNKKFDKLKSQMLFHKKLGPFLQAKASVFDEDAAREAMRDWVRGKFTPLLDFAFYDAESPNGFAWPDVELREELQDQFGGEYPDELILKVAEELEEHGPWGVEMDPADAEQ